MEALTSNSPILTSKSTMSIPEVHKNDDYLACDLPPTYENAVNYISPVLEKLLDKRRQRDFLGKVLAIVALQHTFILSLVLLGTLYAPTYLIVRAHNLVWLSLLLMFITSCVIVCCSTSLLRKLPVNITMLFFLTLTTGFLFTSMTIASRSHTTLWTIGTITINVMALVIFNFQSKWDLTTWNAMSISLIVVQTLNLIRVFVGHESSLTLSLSGAVIMLYFFTIVYDLRLIVARKHEIDTSLKEYSFVALNIHVDILILYLLRRCFDLLTSDKMAAVQTGPSTGPYQKLTSPNLEANINRN